jgi:hypothetical protein
MKKLTIYSAFLITFALMSGCAAPARIDQMAAYSSPIATNPKFKSGIGVADVTGGKETNPMWTSQVSSNDFRRALEISLENSGMFSRVLAGSKYRLTADMVKLDQPAIGFDMTVSSTVRYSLIDMVSNKEVYGRVVQIGYTAKFSDSFLGAERLRLANEGAVKVNIQALIDDLNGLKLPN